MKENTESKKVKKDTIKIVRSSEHRSHYVIGAVPQWTGDDLRLHLYNEVIEGADGPYYIASTQIILPRSAVPRFIEAIRSAVRSDGLSKQAEITSIPLEVSVAIENGLHEKEKRPRKKKVQKIRRK
ncbi:MAG: hypothetical protein JW939_03560 [Candidatus Thermoplasmatota archaeon]|nr:hypothetical protein [Candidatus Thermoplasmatota archaeon]